MKKHYLIPAVVAWLGACSLSWAVDTIKTTTRATYTGRITQMSALAVSIDKNGVVKEVPVNEIEYIVFDGEPSPLNAARSGIRTGRYEDALEALGRIDLTTIQRKEILQDIQFFKALCEARLALAGNGEIKEAGKEMVGFVNAQRDSYHWLKANEIVGDLLVALRSYAAAQKYYATVGQAPWPDYKMRAGVALGRAQLAEGKTADAMKTFQSVAAMEGQGEQADYQKLAATLGQARCLAAEKKYDEAVKIAEEIIAKADPEATELNAEAYNTLGTALKKAGKTKDALLAFLHVDVLYFAVPEAHAEALANLAQLWKEVRKMDRAEQAEQTLVQRYKNSPWANQ